MTITIHDADIIDPPSPAGRRGDGGTYLIVADESDEFLVGLRYAARLARANRGHLCIVYAINIDDFQHWNNIESRMRREMREQAEKFVWTMARRVNDLNGMIPGLAIIEGPPHESLVDLINQDETIKMLVLGGGTQIGGPGPLVTYFTGKGLARLRIPVLVVPGHLEPQKIDAIC